MIKGNGNISRRRWINQMLDVKKLPRQWDGVSRFSGSGGSQIGVYVSIVVVNKWFMGGNKVCPRHLCICTTSLI
jgi:hypothetical protein